MKLSDRRVTPASSATALSVYRATSELFVGHPGFNPQTEGLAFKHTPLRFSVSSA